MALLNLAISGDEPDHSTALVLQYNVDNSLKSRFNRSITRAISPDDLFLLLEGAVHLLQLGPENVPQVGYLRLHHGHHLLEHLQKITGTSQSNVRLPLSP